MSLYNHAVIIFDEPIRPPFSCSALELFSAAGGLGRGIGIGLRNSFFGFATFVYTFHQHRQLNQAQDSLCLEIAKSPSKAHWISCPGLCPTCFPGRTASAPCPARGRRNQIHRETSRADPSKPRGHLAALAALALTPAGCKNGVDIIEQSRRSIESQSCFIHSLYKQASSHGRSHFYSPHGELTFFDLCCTVVRLVSWGEVQ